MEQIPYIVFESAMARFERSNKRLWIVILVLIISLLGTNAGWIYYESQWQVVEATEYQQDVEQETDDGGNNTFVGGDYYGSTENENNSK